MRRCLTLLLVLIAACGGEGRKDYGTSRAALSVRGWVTDVKDAERGITPEVELARRQQLFQSTSIWVEDAPFVTGGFAENGAFVMLDVPQSSVIGFNAPGAETAQLVLEGIPGGSDVFIPDIVLEPEGATILDPSKIVIRLPMRVDKPVRSEQTGKVGGHTVPVIHTPLSHMTDRHEFPNPGGFRPVATYK
jgi:hypothetical protein